MLCTLFVVVVCMIKLTCLSLLSCLVMKQKLSVKKFSLVFCEPTITLLLINHYHWKATIITNWQDNKAKYIYEKRHLWCSDDVRIWQQNWTPIIGLPVIFGYQMAFDVSCQPFSVSLLFSINSDEPDSYEPTTHQLKTIVLLEISFNLCSSSQHSK